MNENQPPQHPFYYFPWWNQQAHHNGNSQQVRNPIDNEVPARVEFAKGFLEFLTFKEMPRMGAGPNTLAVEVVPGLKLAPGELEARQAACDLLTRYFSAGAEKDDEKVPDEYHGMDSWEQMRHDGYALVLQGMQKPPSEREEVTLIRCPSCGAGAMQAQCLMCRGMGTLGTFPMRKDGGPT